MSNDRMQALTVIKGDILRVHEYVKAVCGELTSPLEIKDEKDLGIVVENIASLKRLKGIVSDYFKPVKEEAKIPYQKAIDDEKAWLESIDKVFKFADERVRIFNVMKKEELRIKAQAEADARAEAERQRLESIKVQAEAAGNTEVALEIEEAKKEVISAPVAEVMLKHRGEDTTMSEAVTIEDFRITNHESLASFLIATGKSHMIILDKKTETQVKKWLLNNPSIKEIDGCEFRRDIKNNYR